MHGSLPTASRACPPKSTAPTMITQIGATALRLKVQLCPSFSVRSRVLQMTAGLLTAILIAILSFCPLRAAAFVHPGVPFTAEDINQLKAHVADGDAPWASGYASLAADSKSALGYT